MASSSRENTADINVWEINLKDQANHKHQLEKFLSDEEQQHAARFRQDKDKDQFIVTRAYLKLLLADEHHVSPEKINIVAGINGKPYLKNYTGIQFNVSHTHERAVIALSKLRIGIDLEFINPAFDYPSVAEFACSEAELKLLRETEDPRTDFFRLWTRKESFLKGLGTGLVNDLKTISCAQDINVIPSDLQGVLSSWKIITTMLPGNYIMSVAHDYFSSPVTVRLLPLSKGIHHTLIDH